MPRRRREADSAGTPHTPAASTPPARPPVETEEERILRLDALYTRIEEEPNAWRMLEMIRDGHVPEQDRRRFLNPFFALVARLPIFESEATIRQGVLVFHYRAATATEEVERLRESGPGQQTKFECFLDATFDGREMMAEIILTEDQVKPVKYLVYRPDNGETEVVDQIPIGDILYMPPQSEMVRGRSPALLLPTGIGEYTNEAALLQEIQTFIQKYFQTADEKMLLAAAGFALLTWAYDRLYAVPYFRALGESGRGKSRLIRTVGAICYRPTFAGGSTTASPIFRLINRYHGTLVIDEADFGTRSDMYDEIIKILNQGFEPGTPVLRSERTGDDNFDVRSYDTFCPKVLATRKRFKDDALESRCLSYRLPKVVLAKWSDGSTVIPAALMETFWQDALALRNKLLSWRFQNYRAITFDPHASVDGVDPRLRQIALPLLAVIQDPTLKGRLTEHLTEHQEQMISRQQETDTALIAQALITVWRADHQGNRVLLSMITEKMGHDHPEEWGTRLPDGSRSPGMSKKIAAVMVDDFKLKKSKGSGQTYIICKREDILQIAGDYNVDMSESAPNPGAP